MEILFDNIRYIVYYKLHKPAMYFVLRVKLDKWLNTMYDKTS